jgi:hypothetical protein
MDSDGQAMPLRRLIDRPVQPPPERLVEAGQQHLHETPVRRAAIDLDRSHLGVLDRHDDRGAQARVTVEPFLGHPIVDCASEHTPRPYPH